MVKWKSAYSNVGTESNVPYNVPKGENAPLSDWCFPHHFCQWVFIYYLLKGPYQSLREPYDSMEHWLKKVAVEGKYNVFPGQCGIIIRVCHVLYNPIFMSAMD